MFKSSVNLELLEDRINKAIENSLDEQAELLISYAKKEVPKKNNDLMNSVEKEKITDDTIRVSFNEPYAAYQHEGKRKDGTHIVRRYTTPGTKKFYIKEPLNTNSGKFASIIVKNFKNQGL